MIEAYVGSFAADWVEGTAPTYEPQKGSSCFNWMRYPDVPWAYPGSDLTAVTLGQGGTIWHSAEATPPDNDGWMEIPVNPGVVAARVAGISKGFLLFDDTGSEWTRSGETFTFRLFPNRFVSSRDQNRQSAPYFTIRLGAEDHEPPDAPADFKSEISDLPSGEAEVSWLTPADRERTPGSPLSRPEDCGDRKQAARLKPRRVSVRIAGRGNRTPEFCFSRFTTMKRRTKTHCQMRLINWLPKKRAPACDEHSFGKSGIKLS